MLEIFSPGNNSDRDKYNQMSVLPVFSKESKGIIFNKVIFNNLRKKNIRKIFFASLLSVYNTTSLSLHEQVCLIRLRFERYFSYIESRNNMMGEVYLET